MQPPGREGRGGNNSRGVGGGGLGGFPGFGDPFAAFGRPSFLSDMFDNDPFFNDPFFTRPFGNLFGNSGGGLFGPSGFFGPSLFPPQGFQGNGRPILIDERPSNLPPESSRRGVHIEELPEDHDIGEDGGPTSNREPIIEHPEDEAAENTGQFSTEITRYEPEIPAQQSRTSNMAHGSRSGNTPFTYSYQSSSVTYGGANGPYYAAHSSRRCGPDGVYEEQHAEKDITSGKESHQVLRGLGNKGRALTRKRNAEGREEKLETLHNLAEDEVQNFERKWETQAEKAFPRHRSSSQRLGSGSGTRSRAVLPSYGGSCSKRDSSRGLRPSSSWGPQSSATSSPRPGSSSCTKSRASSRPKNKGSELGQPGPSAVSKSRVGPPLKGEALRHKGELKSSNRESRRSF